MARLTSHPTEKVSLIQGVEPLLQVVVFQNVLWVKSQEHPRKQEQQPSQHVVQSVSVCFSGSEMLGSFR